MSSNFEVKERTLWMLVNKMWNNLERKYLGWSVFLSVLIVGVLNLFFEKTVLDIGVTISFYSTLVGFGIASLSFFSSSSGIVKKNNFPKAISAVTLNQILCIIALLITLLGHGAFLDILNLFFFVIVLLWTFHCSIHVASICLN